MTLESINNATLVWGVPNKDALDTIKEKNYLVVVPEQRPTLLGLRIVELFKEQGVKTVYCTDNTLGLLFYKKKIAKTFIFSLGCSDNGVIAQSGGLYVSLLSKLHGVPIEVCNQGKLDFLSRDKSALTIQGNNLVAQAAENKAVMPEDEVIGWEVLNAVS